jgi:VWFA-related protein
VTKTPLTNLFSVSFVLLAFFLFGQELKERVNVELVQIDVVATDSHGTVVTDLKSDDFVLKEDGKEQKITHFYNSATDETRYPLTMSFVVDTSYSMGEPVAGMTRIDVALQAANMVMEDLKPHDQLELIEFNKEPKAIVPFTLDMDDIRSKFKSLTFEKASTAFHDAMVFSIDQMKPMMGGRKIIVVFSDGVDSSSKLVEDDVINAIHKSDATIIAFYAEYAAPNFAPAGRIAGGYPSNRVQSRAGEDILREYAEMSGGAFFSFHKEPELVKALEDFREFVNSQYTLAYTPLENNKKAGWRKIKVECKRKGIHLRYREGYSVS